VDVKQIDVGKAFPACRQAVESYPAAPRFAFQLGRVYEGDSKFSDAANWYRRAAEAGYPAAQSNLGAMYAHGRGVVKNDLEAVRFYRLAAGNGHPRGQSHLGYMFASGRGGLPPNDFQAVRLFRLAADQGDAYGQAYLGRMYEEGRGGLVQDIDRALYWYRLAAAQGNKFAQESLEALRNMQRYRMGVRWRSLHKTMPDPAESDFEDPAVR
jgi:TPR repeat protein